MKPKRILTYILTLLCMTALLSTGVCAVDPNDPRFVGKTWEEVMNDFLTMRLIDPAQVTAGYYNTITGEEHYHNPDTLMYGASTAKLPTNMIYAERVSKGEMTMDTLIRGNRYGLLQELSLINSDNPAQTTMVTDLGGGNYVEFRKQLLPYIGETEETVDPQVLERNFFKPTHLMSALKLLYGNPERFPGIEECLLKASPFDYFKGNQPPYDIAHKYGWYTDNGTTYLNDTAIIYTDDPILLVMYTANVENARYVLADFCSYMIDYAQFTRLQRYVSDTNELTDLTLPESLEFLSAEVPAVPVQGYAPWQYACMGIGGVFLLIALILVFKKRLPGLAALFTALVLVAVGISPALLAHTTVTNGSAVQMATDFSRAFHADSRGVEYITGCDSVMAHSEDDDLANRITMQVEDSFKLTASKAYRTGNTIAVDVTAKKADIHAVADYLNAQWESSFSAAIAAADPAVLYDSEGNYDSTLADAALEQAVTATLDNWNDFMHTEETTLHLSLTLDGFTPTWKFLCTEEFLSLVNYK